MNKRLDLELLQGSVDLHIHSAPAPFPRPWDDAELAQLAKAAGMKAIVTKDHHMGTSARAYYARKLVPDFEIFGGIALNSYEGGINPYAVEAEMVYGGKIVWMPTVTAAAHLAHFGKPSFTGYTRSFRPVKGISILRDGQVIPEIREVCEMIAEHDVILATAHLSLVEIETLVDVAFASGVKKVLITHVNFQIPSLSVAEQVRLANRGCFIEYTYLPMSPMWFHKSPKEVAGFIREVGPARAILSTDVGNYYNPPPPEAFRCFIQCMLEEGIKPEEIERMVKVNPAKLLGLD
jgi:hypothetical protein